jgi:hypothetical protein
MANVAIGSDAIYLNTAGVDNVVVGEDVPLSTLQKTTTNPMAKSSEPILSLKPATFRLRKS